MRWPFFEACFLLRDPALDSRIDKNPLPEDVRSANSSAFRRGFAYFTFFCLA
jgi:hypothetical protein